MKPKQKYEEKDRERNNSTDFTSMIEADHGCSRG
jgi:hypothetical protein